MPLPTLAEQAEIVSVIRTLEERERTECESVSALVTARTALMSVLLTGEVRVNLDEATA
jgi:type I restriction enzyme S subunit